MDRQLAEVQPTVDALRLLLEPAGGALSVEYRTVPATRVRAINVAPFAGQTVTVNFNFTGTEDISLQTSFVVDDTALTVS